MYEQKVNVILDVKDIKDNAVVKRAYEKTLAQIKNKKEEIWVIIDKQEDGYCKLYTNDEKVISNIAAECNLSDCFMMMYLVVDRWKDKKITTKERMQLKRYPDIFNSREDGVKRMFVTFLRYLQYRKEIQAKKRKLGYNNQPKSKKKCIKFRKSTIIFLCHLQYRTEQKIQRSIKSYEDKQVTFQDNNKPKTNKNYLGIFTGKIIKVKKQPRLPGDTLISNHYIDNFNKKARKFDEDNEVNKILCKMLPIILSNKKELDEIIFMIGSTDQISFEHLHTTKNLIVLKGNIVDKYHADISVKQEGKLVEQSKNRSTMQPLVEKVVKKIVHYDPLGKRFIHYTAYRQYDSAMVYFILNHFTVINKQEEIALGNYLVDYYDRTPFHLLCMSDFFEDNAKLLANIRAYMLNKMYKQKFAQEINKQDSYKKTPLDYLLVTANSNAKTIEKKHKFLLVILNSYAAYVNLSKFINLIKTAFDNKYYNTANKIAVILHKKLKVNLNIKQFSNNLDSKTFGIYKKLLTIFSLAHDDICSIRFVFCKNRSVDKLMAIMQQMKDKVAADHYFIYDRAGIKYKDIVIWVNRKSNTVLVIFHQNNSIKDIDLHYKRLGYSVNLIKLDPNNAIHKPISDLLAKFSVNKAKFDQNYGFERGQDKQIISIIPRILQTLIYSITAKQVNLQLNDMMIIYASMENHKKKAQKLMNFGVCKLLSYLHEDYVRHNIITLAIKYNLQVKQLKNLINIYCNSSQILYLRKNFANFIYWQENQDKYVRCENMSELVLEVLLDTRVTSTKVAMLIKNNWIIPKNYLQILRRLSNVSVRWNNNYKKILKIKKRIITEQQNNQFVVKLKKTTNERKEQKEQESSCKPRFKNVK